MLVFYLFFKQMIYILEFLSAIKNIYAYYFILQILWDFDLAVLIFPTLLIFRNRRNPQQEELCIAVVLDVDVCVGQRFPPGTPQGSFGIFWRYFWLSPFSVGVLLASSCRGQGLY